MITKKNVKSKGISIHEETLTQLLEVISATLSQNKNCQKSQQIEALEKEVCSLRSQLQTLQEEFSQWRAQQNKAEEAIHKIQQPEHSKDQQVNHDEKNLPIQPKSPNQQTPPPDEAKAEKWAWEHLAEWLDSPCPFAKAQKRTWRELAENYGEKIVVKGNATLPRAYLHVVESWQSCQVWARVKAKVALQAVKNGNGVHSHYGHPVEIN